MLQKLASPFREFGLGAGGLYLLDRALRALSPSVGLQVYHFMVQPIGGKPLLPVNLSKNLSAQAIEPGHPAVAEMPAREEIKAQRFAQGAQCLGAYRKGELIGYLWYARERYREDEVRCDYVLAEPSDSVFDFDLYVLPKHRLGLGFVGLWHVANEVLGSAGVRYTFSRVTVFNVASRRAHAKLGWKRVASGLFLQAWRLEFMLASVRPFIGITLGPNQRVTLKLRPDVLAKQVSAAAG
ncbi:hypothetical protein D621_11680 [beta proteobacterium AAP51]|nr:hypothetical protein D621_11680 [beta proteobacterium AAP51]